MSNATEHPPRESLEAYLVGGLTDAEFETVCGHLEQCSPCVEKAATLQIGDPLIWLLTSAAKNDLAQTHSRQYIDTVISGSASCDTDGLGIAPFHFAPEIPADLANHPRYRIIRILGRGGMGTVWLAEHLLLNRLVAIKSIHPEFLAKPGATERLRREMHAAAKLSHVNVVSALDAETSPGASFLVTEYIEGKTLAELIAEGPFSVAHACRAARDAALGLAHAHAAGLIHRDVKPANLIESKTGQVKLLDLGLVSPLPGQSELTGENMVMGTPDYVSPEQALDPRSADARSDIYSLGCTLYHLLTGKAPFEGNSTLGKLDDHRWRQPLPQTAIPGALWKIVSRMLAKRPEDRYASALEVAEALDSYCITESDFDHAVMCELSPPQVGREMVRHRTIIALAAFSFLLLLVVAAFGIYRIQTDQGELVIITFDEDVEVVIKENGKNVTIIDTRTRRSLKLHSGAYELALKDGESGLSLDLEKVTLKRGETAIARIVRNPSNDQEKPAKLSGKNEESRTLWAPSNASDAEIKPTSAMRVLPGLPPHGHASLIRSLEFSADSKLLISCGYDSVQAWDIASGQIQSRIEPANVNGATGKLFSVLLLKDQRRLFECSEHTVREIDLKNAEEPTIFATAANNKFTNLAVSSDQALLAVPTFSGAVNIYDLRDRALLYTIPDFTGGPTYCSKWLPNSHMILSGQHLEMVVFDLDSKRKILSAPITSGCVSVAVAPELPLLACIDWEGTIHLFESKTWSKIRTIHGDASNELPRGRCCFSTQGRLIVGGRGHLLEVIDASSGRTLEVYNGHEAQVCAVAASSDGKWIASGDEAGEIRIWEMPIPIAESHSP